MPLTLTLRFPTERYVAARPSNREELEWPPHPARLMLALLATHHRCGGQRVQRAALDWLCAQSPPELFLPPESRCTRETMGGIYVPQNPTVAKSLSHPLRLRAFPSLILPEDRPLIIFHWPHLTPAPSIRSALTGLVKNLSRFGHSSSLVAAELDVPIPSGRWHHLLPLAPDALSSPEFRLRVGWPGLLESAENAFDAAGRKRELIAAFERRDHAAGRGEPLTKFEISSPDRYHPHHVTIGYSAKLPEATSQGPWENSLFVLRQTGGDRMGLHSIWQLATTLHKTLLDRWSRDYPRIPIPSWISGHGSAGVGSAPSTACHLAIIPLPHVGHPHSDGRLLGLAIAMPRAESIGISRKSLREQWRDMLAALLDDGRLELSPRDKAWRFELVPDDGCSGRVSLLPSIWCQPSRVWKSVTPIILDRHPKPHFKKDPRAWEESCRAILTGAYRRIGLPDPESIVVSPYSSIPGVPSAPAFVAPEPRDGRPARFHLHATLRFAEEIAGPLILGAGRFRGYGLLKPCPNDSPDE